MSFTDFEYNGQKLSDFGCMVCSFNSAGLETTTIGSNLSTMSTAIRISTMILKQALKELFCD